jgi:hypothetical protein
MGNKMKPLQTMLSFAGQDLLPLRKLLDSKKKHNMSEVSVIQTSLSGWQIES